MATEHPKTRAMNIVGGIGLTVMGIAQFFHKMAELPVEMLAAIVAFWLALVLVAVGTARALSANTSPALRTTMFWQIGLSLVFGALVSPEGSCFINHC